VPDPGKIGKRTRCTVSATLRKRISEAQAQTFGKAERWKLINKERFCKGLGLESLSI